MTDKSTEFIDPELIDFDLRSNDEILSVLVENQQQAALAVSKAKPDLDNAIARAAEKLVNCDRGRLVLVGAGASGRIAVQDGAELWPTFGWPAERLLCCMAGGEKALVHSIEGVEDDAVAAQQQVTQLAIGEQDVIFAVAASGRSAWTCSWLQQACDAGALGIGMANNSDTPLLRLAHCPVFLDTGSEVLAGSTRMTAGTAQKIALNLFSTTLMIRLNRTYGNLMVDMAAVNAKLDHRRIRLLKGVLPKLSDDDAVRALNQADGWVKLAALIACGDSPEEAKNRLSRHAGSLRASLSELD